MNFPFKQMLLLVVTILLLLVINLVYGSVHIPFRQVTAILAGQPCERESWRFIVVESRLPQAVTALLAGGALAVCGLLLQTAFRNPLADPSIFGINSGAGLGVALVMLASGGTITAGAWSVSGFMAVMAGAFAGAMGVMALIWLFSTRVRSNILLLIIGIMVGYVASSAITVLNFFATQEGVKSYMVWGMGNFGGVSLEQLPLFSVLVVSGLVCAMLLIKPLNVFLLGERYAENLGVNIVRTRNMLLVVTGVLTSVVTTFCGPVSFIGLAVPHVARLLLRTDNHLTLLPFTLLCGAAMGLLCNALCVLPGDIGVIPLSAVTPIIGAPVIVYVILKVKH
ncbi:MAG: iron ABC transporter permease [Prevotella sp.]|nr:iron ABC transporter permease [Prevotella sp.]MDD7046762.1 iron ABC transporter permease [Prevotella sp.]MDY5547255.1 iron ABC transporter permease [Prevotella sp.]